MMELFFACVYGYFPLYLTLSDFMYIAFEYGDFLNFMFNMEFTL